MFFSTLTLKYDPETGHIDDERFQVFAKDKEVLSVKEHFYLYRELPHITLCVSWRLTEPGSGLPKKAREAWRNLIETPEQEELFDRLRRWRAEKARKEGVPAYTIMTNKQLAETSRIKPRSKAALGKINGLGPARVDRFGKEIIEIMGIQ